MSIISEDKIAGYIGEALSLEELEKIVYTATGKSWFVYYTNKSKPVRIALSETLQYLTNEGTVRWLVTYVLAAAITNAGLRRVIIQAYPQTLTNLPEVEKQVERIIEDLTGVMNAILDVKHELAGVNLEETCRDISLLFSLKSLHECLHTLHLKVSLYSPFSRLASLEGVEARTSGVRESFRQTQAAAAKARAIADLLSVDPENKTQALGWVIRLEQLLAHWENSLDSKTSESWSFVLAVQKMLPLEMARLDSEILKVASRLSFDNLVSKLPYDVQDAISQFDHDIHELNPTVVARAIEHRMWQDADNGIHEMEHGLASSAEPLKFFQKKWLVPRSIINWLLQLYPAAVWAQELRNFSEQIDHLVECDEPAIDDLRDAFELYQRAVRYRFFLIDSIFKKECASLHKLDEPIRRLIRALSYE